MKLLSFLTTLIIAGLLSTNVASGQNSYCSTPANSNHNLLNTQMSQENSSALGTNYCLKVYMHVIRKSNGTGGQTISSVNNAFSILNADFNPFNIKFIWDGSIDYIDNTTHYNSPGDGIFSINNHTDGIDIYLYDQSAPAGGKANGVGNSSEFRIGGMYWGQPSISLVESHVISHEMGHVLFLWHTHHGTINEGGNDITQCAELVNGSNGSTCGDYVFDTPADPFMNFNVSHPSCNWLSSGTDSNGDSYDPDENNIMSYTNVNCMEYFTMQQGLRMRNAISSLPHLQSTIVNQCCIGSTLDLYMRDRYDDNGNDAGYTWTWDFDDSPDIWVRNQADGLTNQNHQNANYDPSSPVYVYIRVGNKSCETSSGNEKLALYWSKASSNSSWPANWDGTYPNVGNKINDVNIPVLGPGQSTIICIPWTIDPNTGVGLTWNNCLLARIENSTTDNITVHTNDLGQDIYQNNNISLRNVIIQDYYSALTSGASSSESERFFLIGNSLNTTNSYDIIFRNPDFTENPVTEVAEITIQLDQQGWNILYPSLQQRADIELLDNYSFRLIGNDPIELSNVSFQPNVRIPVKVLYNFLVEEVDNIYTYEYHIAQKFSAIHPTIGDHWTGGLHFTINIGPRDLFEADAGSDIQLDQGDEITITANQINEAAEYNWYDSDGNLIYTGLSLVVSPEVTEQYQLEVIADSDGFKDYDEVNITVNPFVISSISPNPTSGYTTIEYNVSGANSAYLMIVGTGSYFTSNNYILDITQSQTTLNLSNYPIGTYTIGLVVDGQLTDATTIVIQ